MLMSQWRWRVVCAGLDLLAVVTCSWIWIWDIPDMQCFFTTGDDEEWKVLMARNRGGETQVMYDVKAPIFYASPHLVNATRFARVQFPSIDGEIGNCSSVKTPFFSLHGAFSTPEKEQFYHIHSPHSHFGTLSTKLRIVTLWKHFSSVCVAHLMCAAAIEWRDATWHSWCVLRFRAGRLEGGVESKIVLLLGVITPVFFKSRVTYTSRGNHYLDVHHKHPWMLTEITEKDSHHAFQTGLRVIMFLSCLQH